MILKNNYNGICILFQNILFLFLLTSVGVLASPCFAKSAEPCVRIYYDRFAVGKDVNDYPRIYAVFLNNLLGHFSEVKNVYITPIQYYRSGQIEACKANFYIGYSDNPAIPKSFLHDFVNTSNTAVWIGQNLSYLGNEALKKIWDIQSLKLYQLDWKHLDSKKEPGFFRDFEYKGEIFPIANQLINYRDNPLFGDTTAIRFVSSKGSSFVTSWITHSSLSIKTPYIVHNKNHWYVAVMPFYYQAEKGSYLIFCDALFDMLGAKPIYPHKKPALIRIEDVNAGYTDPKHIMRITDLMDRLNVPFSIAIIPIFKDPLGFLNKKLGDGSQLLSDNSKLFYALLYAKDHGGSFIWHGVTHQYDKVKNPFNGMSGADFEFWDSQHETPIAEDSVEFVLNRLQHGADDLAKMSLKPVAWMCPHYLASSLDYLIFAQVFLWNIGKTSYLPDCEFTLQKLPVSLTFDRSWPGNLTERLNYLRGLTVVCKSQRKPISQLFPYETVDIYGQRLIPETLGNIQPYFNVQVIHVETVNDIIQAAKRNRVLRDVWASFFIHPSMLNYKGQGGISEYPGDVKWLEKLITQIQAYDYEFVDLNKWTQEKLSNAS